MVHSNFQVCFVWKSGGLDLDPRSSISLVPRPSLRRRSGHETNPPSGHETELLWEWSPAHKGFLVGEHQLRHGRA